jgi:hypothetical protein
MHGATLKNAVIQYFDLLPLSLAATNMGEQTISLYRGLAMYGGSYQWKTSSTTGILEGLGSDLGPETIRRD